MENAEAAEKKFHARIDELRSELQTRVVSIDEELRTQADHYTFSRYTDSVSTLSWQDIDIVPRAEFNLQNVMDTVNAISRALFGHGSHPEGGPHTT
jgi:predicted mannosyl-3-phosphoglycerate phosphatase (HAD superfamily)